MKNYIDTTLRLIQYNIKIIYGNKFIYFVLSAIGFYVLTVIINLFSDAEITDATGYGMLLVPSILLIFYPMCFGIQNDQDAKIIEVIFGIPNYRYKVWLFRLIIAYLICFVLTLGLAFLTDWLLVEVPPFMLTFQVLVPAFFIGMLCFMLSTIVKNGNGTAVVIIILGLIFYILSNTLGTSKWNVFLNPFDIPLEINPIIFQDILFDNRLILILASILFLLIGLYNT
ncbi:MAG: hypothetical protein LIO65_05835, partial [Odoribacter sp.]|nr:hypothetical protein [Odoribacter sp.]